MRQVIINFRDDPESAIRGILWSQRGPWLTFRDCHLLKPSQPPTPMDGEVIVHRARIAFFQVP